MGDPVVRRRSSVVLRLNQNCRVDSKCALPIFALDSYWLPLPKIGKEDGLLNSEECWADVAEVAIRLAIRRESVYPRIDAKNLAVLRVGRLLCFKLSG